MTQRGCKTVCFFFFLLSSFFFLSSAFFLLLGVCALMCCPVACRNVRLQAQLCRAGVLWVLNLNLDLNLMPAPGEGVRTQHVPQTDGRRRGQQ